MKFLTTFTHYLLLETITRLTTLATVILMATALLGAAALAWAVWSGQ